MKILGHRGARFEAPENTLAGIELALAAGVDGVEIDVRRTRDGRIVVIHDATVDRTTDGAGLVSEMTFDEVRALDAGSGERVPSLEDVVEALRGRGELVVELKEAAHATQVAQRLRELDATGFCCVIGFDHRALLATRDAVPELRTGCLLVARPVDPVSVVRAAAADFLSIQLASVDADIVAACHRAGIAACAWNCNDPAEVARYRDLGLDWLGTDEPAALRAHTGG